MTNPGDCPQCNAFDDDLDHRGGICEACYQEHNDQMGCNSDPYINYLNMHKNEG